MEPIQPDGKQDEKKVLGSGKDWLRLTRKLLQDILILIGDWLKRTSKLLLTSIIFLIIGVLGLAITRNGFFWLLLIVGIIVLFVWITRRFIFPIIGREDVVERWDVLIGGAQGRAENIFDKTQKLIVTAKTPDIKMEKTEVAPGVLRGFLGGKRPFLVISNTTSYYLRLYRMFINARDYGNYLQVSWYLVYQPGFWRKLAALLLLIPFLNLYILPFYLLGRLIRSRSSGLLDLDTFDEQDLRAYVTIAHHCLLEVVDNLMIELNKDPSKIERKSRGFLGIS